MLEWQRIYIRERVFSLFLGRPRHLAPWKPAPASPMYRNLFRDCQEPVPNRRAAGGSAPQETREHPQGSSRFDGG